MDRCYDGDTTEGGGGEGKPYAHPYEQVHALTSS